MRFNNETYRGTTTSVVTLFTGLGVAAVVKEIIASNITPPTTKWGKFKILAGSTVLVSLVSDAADQHVEGKINSLFDFADKVSKKVKEAKDGASESAGEQPQAEGSN